MSTCPAVLVEVLEEYAFGLKQIFKDNVHCFFAEPTASPCMLLGLLTGLHGDISVRDFNLSNVTEADGLAVASSSTFVGKAIGRDDQRCLHCYG